MKFGRKKLALIITTSFFVVAFGVVGILAKTGTINLKMLADTVGIKSSETSQNVTITVKKDKAPVAGALVSVDGSPASGIDPISGGRASSTNTNGQIILSVISGKHNYSAGFPPDCGATAKDISTPPQTSVELNLTCGAVDTSKAHISGRIIISGTLTGIEGAVVSTNPATLTFTTATGGVYSLDVSPDTNYQISASKSGYEMTVPKIETGSIPANTTKTIDIQMKAISTPTPKAHVSGCVVDEAGNKIPDAKAYVDSISLTIATTGSDGCYGADLASGLEYVISANKTGYLTKTSVRTGGLVAGENKTLDNIIVKKVQDAANFDIYGKITLKGSSPAQPVAIPQVQLQINSTTSHIFPTKDAWITDLGANYSDLQFNYYFQNIASKSACEGMCKLIINLTGTDYTFADGSTRIEKTLYPSAYSRLDAKTKTNIYLRRQDTEFEVVDNAFDIVGAINYEDSNIPLIMQIHTRSYTSGAALSTDSKDIWIGTLASGGKYNYHFENVPLKSTTDLKIIFRLPDDTTAENNVDGIVTRSVRKSDIHYDAALGSNVYVFNLVLRTVADINYIVDFFDAEDGHVINTKDDQGEIEIEYIDHHNYINRFNKFSVSYDQDIPNRIIIKIKPSIAHSISGDGTWNQKILHYNSKNYVLVDSFWFNDSDFPLKLFLVKKDRVNESLPCEEHFGFNFCMEKFPIYDQLTAKQKEKITKLSKILSNVRDSAGLTDGIPIYIIPLPFNGAEAYINRDIIKDHKILGSDSSLFVTNNHKIALSLSVINDFDIKTLLHEYFHILDSTFRISSEKFKFDKITIQGNTEEARKVMIINSCCRNKQFPNFDYSVGTNNLELWAEFSTWWYLHNDEFQKAIASPDVSEPCKEVLKFMYEVLRQNYPGITPYQPVAATSSVERIDQQVGIWEKAILTSTGSVPDDEFNNIMKEGGFVPSTLLPVVETSAPLDEISFSSDDIIKGKWRKEVVDSLPPAQKIKIETKIAVGKIITSQFAINARQVIATIVSDFNKLYDSFLKSIGKYKETGKLSGTIVDKKNGRPISDVIVKVAGKIATTNSNGDYIINDVQSGSQSVEMVTDIKNNDNYAVFENKTFDVKASRNNKITSTISFPLAKIIGRLTDKDGNPLAKAKVTFSSTQKDKVEATTNDNGEFTATGLYYKKYNVGVFNSKNQRRQPQGDSVSVTPDRSISLDEKSNTRIVNFDVVVNKQ
ncbi:MAG: hypothetical protein Athens101428_215 [Candidatus Berkelbacteria bacterium Athens1014_28]|uniref:Carboxypeptidase regulatory-like domain-containing protein n=1 Tax=Candidatus Berkelbacteria bacterium Athens1014_28 TaxID=2017145 RepID=A0A554LPA0_9BACT|nr:MAG: hypothetical protein Athens101428_215 [Candidatus Berkelbacteria bacterium Athens1014_28]